MLHYLSLLCICLSFSLANAAPKLVFSDDFNRDGGIDKNKWEFEIGGPGWGNMEQQHYTNRTKSARCERGHLILEAHKENLENNNYTSARIRTKQAWKYGRWQIRARLPKGNGLWTAIWMMPQHQSYGTQKWPDNGEINIMEQVGFDPLNIHVSVHTLVNNHIRKNHPTNIVKVNDAVTNFKIYTLDWKPNAMSMFVGDDSNPFKIRTFIWEKKWRDWTVWPFNKPFYLLINLAVGGHWPGQHGIAPDIFPAKFEIDWVKYYQ